MIRINKPALCAAISLTFFSSPSIAQVDVSPQQSTPVILVAPTENVIRAGSEVILKTREELTTQKKKLKVGYRFQMEVAEPLRLNGQIIIPSGTPAIGEVTEVRNKGMWGKSGYVGARAISMRVGDRTIRLNGAFDDKGVTGTAGVVAAVILIPVVGFFTTGTSAMIPSGSNVKAFLDEDIAIAVASVPQPVMLTPVTQSPIPAAVQSTASQVIQTGPGEVALKSNPK